MLLRELTGIGLAEPAGGRTLQAPCRPHGAALAAGDRRCLALALLYNGAAQVGYALQFSGPVAAIVWLPVGVGIAFLYRGGLSYWPGVLVGDLLANDYGTLPLGTALIQTSGNLLEVIVATLLLRRLVPGGDPLASVRGVGRMFVAIGAGAVVSAIIGTCASFVGGVIDASEIPRVWRTWWMGDYCGALLVLPLALAWAKPLTGWSRRRVLETVGVLVAVAVVSLLAVPASESLTYVVFPPLLWAALRLDRRGATLAVAVASGFAVYETTRRTGPFAFESITESVLATQLYIAVAALSTCAWPRWWKSARQAATSLAASRARIVEAGARERHRIEQNLHDGAQQRLTALLVRLRLAAERAREEPVDAPRPRSRPPSCSWRRRSRSCASWRTASTRRPSRTTGSRTRSSGWPRNPRSRCTCASVPPRASI